MAGRGSDPRGGGAPVSREQERVARATGTTGATTTVTGRREICEARSKVDAVLGEHPGDGAPGEPPDLRDDGPPTAEVAIVRPAPAFDRDAMREMRRARVRASAPPSPDVDVTTRIKVLDAQRVEADAASTDQRPSSHATLDTGPTVAVVDHL